MGQLNRSGKKSLSLWIWGIAIAVVIVAGVIYALWPSDTVNTFWGKENIGKANDEGKLWKDLTVFQKESLAPLEEDWDTLSGTQKKKWLEIVHKMETMSLEERQRIQRHIRDWLKLTPEQRRMARENFLDFKKLNPEGKTEKWKEYQQLPEEKKRALARKAKAKRRLTNLTDEPSEEQPPIIEPVKPPEEAPKTIQQKDEIPEYWR